MWSSRWGSPGKDSCLWLLFQQPERKSSSESRLGLWKILQSPCNNSPFEDFPHPDDHTWQATCTHVKRNSEFSQQESNLWLSTHRSDALLLSYTEETCNYFICSLLYIEQDLGSNHIISWNYQEFEVRYECLSDEIKIGDYYLRLLLEEDEGKTLINNS